MFVSLFTVSMAMAGQYQPAPAIIWRANNRVGDIIDLYLARPQYCDGISCHPEYVYGGYDYETQKYFPYNTVLGKWMPENSIPKIAPKLPPPPANTPNPAPKPVEPPRGPPNEPSPQKPPTGVIHGENAAAGQRCEINGVPFSSEEAIALLQDDSALPYLTVIANKDQWRSILDTLPKDLVSRCRLKCMPPDFWASKKFKVPVGSTGVFYQAIDGKKLAAQAPYDAEKFLAQLKATPAPLPLPLPETPEPPLAPKPVKAGAAGSYLYLLLAIGLILFARKE